MSAVSLLYIAIILAYLAVELLRWVRDHYTRAPYDREHPCSIAIIVVGNRKDLQQIITTIESARDCLDVDDLDHVRSQVVYLQNNHLDENFVSLAMMYKHDPLVSTLCPGKPYPITEAWQIAQESLTFHPDYVIHATPGMTFNCSATYIWASTWGMVDAS